MLEDTTAAAETIGYAYRDESFPVLKSSERYIQVLWGNTPAWLEREHVLASRKRSSPLLLRLNSFTIMILVVVFVLICIAVLLYGFKLGGSRKSIQKKSALILAREKKLVQDYFTKETKTIEQCLADISIVGRRVEKLKVAQNWALSHPLDLIMVDWRFSETV